jgi:hypothetical protein
MEEDMKKLIVVLMGALFIAGCAGARESGFYDHNTMYKDWDHLKFSIFGYKNVDPKAAQMSKEGDWWGLPVVGSK